MMAQMGNHKLHPCHKSQKCCINSPSGHVDQEYMKHKRDLDPSSKTFLCTHCIEKRNLKTNPGGPKHFRQGHSTCSTRRPKHIATPLPQIARPGHQDDSCSMLFFASCFPHAKEQYFSFKKKINCPQQSTYSVLGKYGLNILLHKANREQSGVRGIHHCRLRFSLFTPNVFRVAKFK